LDLQQEVTDLKKDTDSKLDLSSIDSPSDSKEEQIEASAAVEQIEPEKAQKCSLFLSKITDYNADVPFTCSICTKKI